MNCKGWRFSATCRSSAALTVIERPGKRSTLMAVGGQENFGIYSGTIFNMIEEYDFEENDWCNSPRQIDVDTIEQLEPR